MCSCIAFEIPALHLTKWNECRRDWLLYFLFVASYNHYPIRNVSNCTPLFMCSLSFLGSLSSTIFFLIKLSNLTSRLPTENIIHLYKRSVFAFNYQSRELYRKPRLRYVCNQRDAPIKWIISEKRVVSFGIIFSTIAWGRCNAPRTNEKLVSGNVNSIAF